MPNITEYNPREHDRKPRLFAVVPKDRNASRCAAEPRAKQIFFLGWETGKLYALPQPTNSNAR